MARGIKGTITHGYGGYTRGCKCDTCTTANRLYKAAWEQRRRRQQQPDPKPAVDHDRFWEHVRQRQAEAKVARLAAL